MSEPTNLVPNLNKIMEEYAELENEIVQATQAVAGQGEERAEVNEELEQIVKGSRKRKRGNEEAKSSEQKANDWVSDLAYIAWKDKLQYRDFIGERVFNKRISPFTEIIEGKGWKLFCEHKSPGFVDVVKEFYANMVGIKDKVMYVRGKWISFDRKQIDQTYNIQERKNESKFKRQVEAPDFQKIVDLLTDGNGKWNATKKNPHESIAKGALTEPAKVWFYFLCSVILPSKHVTPQKNPKIFIIILLYIPSMN